MSVIDRPEAARVWYRPGIADVLFLLVALAVLRGARHSLLDDPGLGWHLRNIDAMREQGGWLRVDPFGDERTRDEPVRPWYTNQWLGELPSYLGWKWAGLEGIAAVNAIVLAFLARSLYRALLDDGLPWPVALVWAALAMMGTSCSWNARPNVFSILFLFFAARASILLHEDRLSRRGAVGLVLLFALWANTHGGFVAGLVTLAATCGIEFGTWVVFGMHDARKIFLRSLALFGAAFLATLINPYGLELYRWVFQLLGDPYFMDLHQEWRSPDFHSGGAIRYELLLLLFPTVLGLSRKRPSLVEVGLGVLWLHMALTGFRYVALWVVVAVPTMARLSIHIGYLDDLASRLKLTAEPGSLFHTPRGPSPWLASLLVAAALLGWSRHAEGTYAVHDQKIIASDSLDRFLDLTRRGAGERPRLFHAYDWGGYLTWHGWPETLTWIDDRNEVQGEKRIRRYFAIIAAEPGWERHLADIDWVCIDPKTPLAARLRAASGSVDPRWKIRHKDDHAIIFERLR
jgi:hypothetical protein